MRVHLAAAALASGLALTNSAAAQAIQFGAPCAGASGAGTEPTLAFSGFPTVNLPFTLDVTGVPSAAGILFIGVSNTNYLGLPLPLDATLFGLPGCQLFTSIDLQAPFALDATGAVSLPGTVTTQGTLFFQAFVLDLDLTTFGGLTNALELNLLAPTGNQGGEVIVTEIMKNPGFVNDEDGEWIELYNTTASSIDIEYWTLADNDVDSVVLDNGGAGIVIPAGGYLVLGRDTDPLVNGNSNVDFAYPFDFFLSNSDDEIVLFDTSGIEIDRVEYDNGVLWPDDESIAFALDVATLDGTLNDDPANWANAVCVIGGPVCNPDLGTPGLANDAACPPPCPTVGSGDLIFSEIMQNPAAVSDDFGEWLEVFNTTGGDIDLLGYSLAWNGIDAIDVSVVVPAGGFAVLARSGDSMLNGGLPTPDYVWDAGLGLGNGDETIAIYDDLGGLVFSLSYDNGATFPDPSGRSMNLDPTKLNATDAVDGANWCTATTPYGDGDFGTPGTANDACNPPASEVGDEIITEIMQNPSAVGNSGGEWFEIFNTTGAPIDVEGWTIADADTDSHVIDSGGAGLIVPAGGFLVLGNNIDTLTNGGVAVDYEFAGLALGNGTDELILIDGSANEQDRVEWDNGATFPDPNGESMSLDPAAFDAASNNAGANWCEGATSFGDGDLGTPGAANDACL